MRLLSVDKQTVAKCLKWEVGLWKMSWVLSRLLWSLSFLYENPVRILKVSSKGRGRDKSWESPERIPLTSDATLRSNLDNRPSSLYFINVSISRVIKCDMCMLKCFNCPPIPSSHRQHVPALCLPGALSHSHCPTYWDCIAIFIGIKIQRLESLRIFSVCQMDYISLLRDEPRNRVTKKHKD